MNADKFLNRNTCGAGYLVYISSLARFSLHPISSASDIICVVREDLGRCCDHGNGRAPRLLFPSPPDFDLSTRCGSADFIDVVAELAISRNDPGSCTVRVVTPSRHVVEDQTASWHKALPESRRSFSIIGSDVDLVSHNETVAISFDYPRSRDLWFMLN